MKIIKKELFSASGSIVAMCMEGYIKTEPEPHMSAGVRSACALSLSESAGKVQAEDSLGGNKKS